MAVLSMVLTIELIVLMLSLFKFKFASEEFFAYFFALSFFMLWIAFVFAILLGFIKSWLQTQSVIVSTIIKLFILLSLTLGFTYFAKFILINFLPYSEFTQIFTQNFIQYLFQNTLIALILGGLLMRYFYLSHQNEVKLKAMNAAQVQALQSRIRPHFLFNSLNTIASLIAIDGDKAEQAVEDLSDLFRVSLASSERRVSLKEELEIARLYQRMEQLRLGDRLEVQWNVNELPLKQKVPALILQPLLENAIYHGIEPLADGGVVKINGRIVDGHNVIEVINPMKPVNHNNQLEQKKEGNKIALENIQARLRLLFGDKAKVNLQELEQNFVVTMRFPSESTDTE